MNEETKEMDIVQSIASTIIDYNIDTVIDFAEINIDSFFDNSFLKELPLVKTIYSVAKTGIAIREKHFLKKTLVFIKQLNSNGISNENYQKYKEKLKKNDKEKIKELEHALIIIDRYLEVNKNIILGNLYFNYIDKNITWNQFQELSIIVDNIFLDDLKELENIYKNQFMTMDDINNKISFRRLKTQNLVEDIETMSRSSDGSISIGYNDYDYKITELGILLFKFGISKSSYDSKLSCKNS